MFTEIYEKYVLKNYKFLLIIGGVIASILGLILINHTSSDVTLKSTVQAKDNTLDEIKVKEEEQKVSPKEKYYVDIKGSITNPNVYQMDEGARIIDVIKLAGGLVENADTSVLNLSKKVTDEMVIIIYNKEELAKFKDDNQTKTEVIKYIEKDCKCPDPIINGACMDNEVSNNDSQSKISLNTATKEELMTLTGIGESKAESIIDYRTTNGSFQTIDDIKNVTGIGDSIFDKIKDNITV